jgi:hypothetical protein
MNWEKIYQSILLASVAIACFSLSLAVLAFAIAIFKGV